MNTKIEIQTIIDKGFELNFGDIFNKSFENYKKIALISGLVFIVLTIIFAILGLGVATTFYGIASFTDVMTNFKIQNFTTSAIIVYIISVVIISGLIAPIYAGLIKIADCAHQNKDFSIATAFTYYQSAYFKPIFISSLIITLITTTISTLTQLIGYQFIGVFVVYIISFFSFLHIPFIIFGNLTAVESILASFNTVKQQIPVLLGLLIVSVLAICLGFFGLCIGIFFTIPFMFSLYYVIYFEIFGVNNLNEIDEIGSIEI